MAYQRRYFPALTITTISYAEKSVTTDKLADKAVTTPKVGDDAITSEKIVDETIKSEDIKAGEVKTPDLADGAVTTPKLADRSVTSIKLEEAIAGVSRPLTPGVATAEIAAGAVTESKLAASAVAADKIKAGAVGAAALAGDAVETGKIKDLAVTRAKIIDSAINNAKIAADAVRGTEIQDGAVSEGKIGTAAITHPKIKDYHVIESKISDDAVATRSILADAVTSLKLDGAALARRHIESKDTRVLTHFDEFNGIDISNKWQKVFDPGGHILEASKDGINIGTGSVNGNACRIDWNTNYLGLPEVLKPLINIWISSRHASLNYLTQNLGLWNNANNHIVFYAHDVGGATPNWFAKCVSAGAVTSIDTGVPIATSIQLLGIDVISSASVKFYINGIEKAEVTTNIPTTYEMEPRLEIITRTSVLRWFKLKYLSILAVRPAYV